MRLSDKKWLAVLKRTDSVALVLLGLSLTFNVYLAHRLHSPLIRPTADLSVGARVPKLHVEDAKGQAVSIDWGADGRPTLVYVFSPSCHWCARNLENIKALNGSISSRYRIFWLSLSSSGLRKYIEDNNLSVPVYTNAVRLDGGRFVLTETPQTILISPDAKVEALWRGAYSPELQRQIEKRFGVKLPGLRADTADGVSLWLWCGH
jgi:hypothetical protein